MKLPARCAPVLFGGLLSTVMVSLVSGLMLFVHEGLHPGFAAQWLRGFASTWPVAFPTVLVVAPLVRRLVARMTAA